MPQQWVRRSLLWSWLLCAMTAGSAFAQQDAAALPGLLKSAQGQFDIVGPNHWRYTGDVEQEWEGGSRFSADQIDLFTDTNRLVAAGNVTFDGPEGRISAEKVEFDIKNRTGTFHVAWGLLSLGPMAEREQFGNQDPDVYFYGETIEKVGLKEYKIVKGGFTTCVQPTPRWELGTSTLTLKLDEYAVARHTVLRVKGVPVMYLPLVYYPIQEDQRATGFLMPTYGTSQLRGQAISNGFFWALGRSHDVTFMHDWFTRAGQGFGTEYRYILAPASQGEFRLYRLNQKEATFTQNGNVSVLPEKSSFEMTGTATHAFSQTVRGRARIDYFSDIVSQQLYHQSIYQASRRSRVVEAGLTAALGRLSTSLLYQRNEIFNDADSRLLYGSTPRATAAVAPQRLFNTPVYGSLSSEYAFLPYRSIVDDVVSDGNDRSLNRLDVTPTLRVPLSRLTYLSLNTSASYRATYYSRSELANALTDDSYLRRYATVRSEVVGPVFTRIWDLPDSGFAERLKHVIEPAFTFDFTSRINDYTRAPVLSDTSDFVVGGVTRVTYGLTNRFFYRGRTENGVRGQTREFVTLGVQQTYYSNPSASSFDITYQSTYGYRRSLDLSPVALTARVSPSSLLDANARVEYDVSGGGLQMLSTGGSLNSAVGSVSLDYSRRRPDRTARADDYLRSSTSLRWLQGRATGSYAIDWDLGRGYIVSQSVNASYLAQCCGVQIEFQNFNYPAAVGFPIPSDRRVNFGFVLAGLGTFSNFFGAFGGNR